MSDLVGYGNAGREIEHYILRKRVLVCSNMVVRRYAIPPRLSGENKDRLDKAEIRLSKLAIPSNIESINQLDSKAAKQGKKFDTISLVRSFQAPSLSLSMQDGVLPTAIDLQRTVPRPVLTSSGISSRSVSPFFRRPSPPRSATPVPTISRLSFSKNIANILKKKNEVLNQEVLMLQEQVESLRQRCEHKKGALQKSEKKNQEAKVLTSGESAKAIAAKEVIKSLTAQLKDATERFPPGVYGTESLKLAYISNGLATNGVPRNDAYGEHHSRSDSMISSYLNSPKAIESAVAQSPRDPLVDDETNLYQQKKGLLISNGSDDHPDIRLPNGNCGFEAVEGKLQDGNNSVKSRNFLLAADSNQVQAEWIEQYEPGVYITLVALQDGTRDLKRVCFSRRRFGEHQAEAWWSENRERVHERYNIRGSDKSSLSSQPPQRSEGAMPPPSRNKD